MKRFEVTVHGKCWQSAYFDSFEAACALAIQEGTERFPTVIRDHSLECESANERIVWKSHP